MKVINRFIYFFIVFVIISPFTIIYANEIITVTRYDSIFIYPGQIELLETERPFWVASQFKNLELLNADHISTRETVHEKVLKRDSKIQTFKLYKCKDNVDSLYWKTSCFSGTTRIEALTSKTSPAIFFIQKNDSIKIKHHLELDVKFNKKINVKSEDKTQFFLKVDVINPSCIGECNAFILLPKDSLQLKMANNDSLYQCEFEISNLITGFQYYFEIKDEFEEIKRYPSQGLKTFIIPDEKNGPANIAIYSLREKNTYKLHSTPLSNTDDLKVFTHNANEIKLSEMIFNSQKNRFDYAVESDEDSIGIQCLLLKDKDYYVSEFWALKDSTICKDFYKGNITKSDSASLQFNKTSIGVKFLAADEYDYRLTGNDICKKINSRPFWPRGVFKPVYPDSQFNLNYVPQNNKIKNIDFPVDRIFSRQYGTRVLWHNLPGIIHTSWLYGYKSGKVTDKNNDWWYWLPASPALARGLYETYHVLMNNHNTLNKEYLDKIDTICCFIELIVLGLDYFAHSPGIDGFGTINPKPWMPPDPPSATSGAMGLGQAVFPLQINFSF